jgi:hypothetical protein
LFCFRELLSLGNNNQLSLASNKLIMKKYLFLILSFACIATMSIAQSNTLNTTGKWGSQIFLSDVNGRPFENKYADINGSAYLFPNFKFASITLSDGRKYNNIKARLNLLEHEVNFIASNGEEGYIGKGMVSTITILDTTKQVTIDYTFKSGYPKIDNQTIINFYQVLAVGKCSLLKSINKNIEERSNEMSGEKSKEFIVRENLYVFINGEMKRVKKDKDFFTGLFADQLSAINGYINSNKINYKSEEGLLKVVNFYNSL